MYCNAVRVPLDPSATRSIHVTTIAEPGDINSACGTPRTGTKFLSESESGPSRQTVEGRHAEHQRKLRCILPIIEDAGHIPFPG